MTMIRTSRWIQAAALALATLGATSCYYDPYYGGGGGGGGYYSGGGGISTTFIYTSSDRWLYDPLVYCYYDRYRGCYYDPYLYGYYPVGYCPRPLYGAYHPHGWYPGRGVLAPPSGFRDRYLSNYQNRVQQLKARNYRWANNVREKTDRAADALRNQRIRAAEKFKDAQFYQKQRNQNMRANQAERMQNMREQQQQFNDKVRGRNQFQQQPQQPQFQPGRAPQQRHQIQRQMRNPYDQPVNTAGGSRQARIAEAQQAQRQAAMEHRAGRQTPSQPQGNGGGGKTWKEKVQDQRRRGN